MVDKFQDDSTINILRLLAINTPHDCISLPHRHVFHRVAGLVLRRVGIRRTWDPFIPLIILCSHCYWVGGPPKVEMRRVKP